MRCLMVAAALGLGLAAASASAAGPKDGPAKEGCGQFGTTVDFLESPAAAAAKAIKQEKLVFVLHVSGLFEDPRFT